MNDMKDGSIVLIVVVALIVGVTLGMLCAHSVIADNCKQLGGFTHNGEVFVCSLRK